MASLNTAASGHGSRSQTYADGSTVAYNAFPVGHAQLEKVRRAMAILDRVAASEPPTGQCNAYFASLPGGSTFTSLWTRASTWVNHSPATTVGLYGDTHTNNQDIALHEWCLNTQNHWMVAATLCHELAHAGGAPGTWHSAELSVQRCGFRDQYDSTLMGIRDRLQRYFIEAYA